MVPLNQGGDTTKATFTKLVYDYTADVSEKTSELRLTLRPLSSYRMDADMDRNGGLRRLEPEHHL